MCLPKENQGFVIQRRKRHAGQAIRMCITEGNNSERDWWMGESKKHGSLATLLSRDLEWKIRSIYD